MKKKYFLMIVLIICLLFIGLNVNAKSIGLNVLADTQSSVSCSGYFGAAEDNNSLMHLIVYNIFVPIRIAVPILLLVFTTIDFSKVVFTDAKDGLEKAKKNFVKRALVAVIIFFIPSILEILFSFIDNQAIKSCMGNF